MPPLSYSKLPCVFEFMNFLFPLSIRLSAIKNKKQNRTSLNPTSFSSFCPNSPLSYINFSKAFSTLCFHFLTIYSLTSCNLAFTLIVPSNHDTRFHRQFSELISYVPSAAFDIVKCSFFESSLVWLSGHYHLLVFLLLP